LHNAVHSEPLCAFLESILEVKQRVGA